MALRQVSEKQLQELSAAARQLSTHLASVQARVAAELKSMGVADTKGSIREFLYCAECDDARRAAHVLAEKINALVANDVNK